MKGTFIDRSGHRAGRLLVLSRAANLGKYVRWLCRCDCGTEKTVLAESLRAGTTTSCGCYHMERLRLPNLHTATHGASKTRTYRIWAGMKKRCLNPNDPAYARYAGRGITICERWLHSFENFLSDMGECPVGLTIERKDNDAGYSPANCKWATAAEQSRNRRNVPRFEVNGESLLLTDIAIRSGIKYATVYRRYRVHGREAIFTLARMQVQSADAESLIWEDQS